jgi:hypothetical protein
VPSGESGGQILFAPRPAKQQNNLSASLPWNGRWGFFLCITFLKKQTTMKRETKIDLKKALREKT